MSREILLLRHGMTAGNRLRRYIGRTDEPLCPEGRAALEEMPRRDASIVYISPMLRCRETAELLFPGCALRCVDGLREMDFGVFENRNFLELDGDADYQAWLDSECNAPIPGGECRADFSDRCCAAFLDTLRTDGSDRLVFVVHGGTIMSVLERFAVPRRVYYDWHCTNGHGYRLRLAQTQPAPVLELLEEV